MDPDANLREQIKLLDAVIRAGGWPSEQDRGRYAELRAGYAEWRRGGGFRASEELRTKVAGLRATATTSGHDV